jgi:hypothetical protein
MQTIKPIFDLKNPNSTTKTKVRMRICFDYNQFVYHPKDSIGRLLYLYPQCWDKKTQKPLSKNKILKKYQSEISNLQIIGETIDKLKVCVNDIANETVLSNKKITKDLLRNELLVKMGLTEKKQEITIHQFCLNTIKEMEEGTLLINSTKRYDKSTIDKYTYTAKILEVFKPNTTFNQIDKDWYKNFIQFLTHSQTIKYRDSEGEEKLYEKKNLQPGSISNYIKNVKFLMGYAVEKEISTNKNHIEKWFERPKEQKGYGNIHIALSESELKELYDFNPVKVGLNLTYDKAKDLFLVGCYTGLRVSDFNSGLTEKDFTTVKHNGKEEKVLIKPTKKTGAISYTPAIWEELQKIFEKYNYQLPVLSENTIRKYTQKICECIKGFEEVKSWFITLGGKTEKIEKSKWQMVGNHTGRRSFITNLKNVVIPMMI